VQLRSEQKQSAVKIVWKGSAGTERDCGVSGAASSQSMPAYGRAQTTSGATNEAATDAGLPSEDQFVGAHAAARRVTAMGGPRAKIFCTLQCRFMRTAAEKTLYLASHFVVLALCELDYPLTRLARFT
jgi:hypothetical protein